MHSAALTGYIMNHLIVMVMQSGGFLRLISELVTVVIRGKVVWKKKRTLEY